VYRPFAVIVPAAADQITAVFAVPDTVAENCCVAPFCRLTAVGKTEMLTFVAGGGVGVGRVTVTAAESDVTAAAPALCWDAAAVAVTVYVPADDGAL